LRRFIVSLALGALALVPICTQADVTTSISAGPANAPAILVACGSSGLMTVDLFNRYNRTLAHVKVHIMMYDDASRFLGQTDIPVEGIGLPPGQTSHTSTGYMEIGGSRWVCKLTYAEFSGPVEWWSGRPWHGKVYYSSPGERASSNGGGAMRTASDVLVGKTVWTTSLASETYVHIRFAVRPQRTTTIRASDFQATFRLAGGGTVTEQGMDAPAPLVVKNNAVAAYFGAQQGSHRAVDPREDLGGLGAIVLPKGQSFTYVVSFRITGELDAHHPVISAGIPSNALLASSGSVAHASRTVRPSSALSASDLAWFRRAAAAKRYGYAIVAARGPYAIMNGWFEAGGTAYCYRRSGAIWQQIGTYNDADGKPRSLSYEQRGCGLPASVFGPLAAAADGRGGVQLI
jgi:hypothetical protein